MKKNYFYFIVSVLLAALFFTQGCIVENLPSTTNTIQPSTGSTTAHDATLSAMFTEGANRNPSATAFKSLTPTPVTPSPTITPTPYYVAKWEISPEASNFAIIVLDYETLEFLAGYFEVHKSCHNGADLVSDEALVSRGYDILNMTYPNFSQKHGEELSFPQDCSLQKIDNLVFSPGCSIQHVGEFALFEIYHGDTGGAVVFDPCTGQVLFAGSIGMGMGGGDQIYPVHPIEMSLFGNETGSIRQPERMDVITSPDSTTIEGFDAAWNSVQTLNLLHDFATYSYSVLIYLYAPGVHEFYPPDAEWLIFLYSQTPY